MESNKRIDSGPGGDIAQSRTVTANFPGSGTSDQAPTAPADATHAGRTSEGGTVEDPVDQRRTSYHCPDEELYDRRPSSSSTASTTAATTTTTSAPSTVGTDMSGTAASSPGSTSTETVPTLSERVPTTPRRPRKLAKASDIRVDKATPISERPTTPTARKSSLRGPDTPRKNVSVSTPEKGQHEVIIIPPEEMHYGVIRQEMKEESMRLRKRLSQVDNYTAVKMTEQFHKNVEMTELNRLYGLPDEDNASPEKQTRWSLLGNYQSRFNTVPPTKATRRRQEIIQTKAPDEVPKDLRKSSEVMNIVAEGADPELAQNLRQAGCSNTTLQPELPGRLLMYQEQIRRASDTPARQSMAGVSSVLRRVSSQGDISTGVGSRVQREQNEQAIARKAADAPLRPLTPRTAPVTPTYHPTKATSSQSRASEGLSHVTPNTTRSTGRSSSSRSAEHMESGSRNKENMPLREGVGLTGPALPVVKTSPTTAIADPMARLEQPPSVSITEMEADGDTSDSGAEDPTTPRQSSRHRPLNDAIDTPLAGAEQQESASGSGSPMTSPALQSPRRVARSPTPTRGRPRLPRSSEGAGSARRRGT
ncbi:hypothetical protein KVT40_005946 [Elsinoe batatas]|uniref:Uncharacterized protein n=1 Tax=Elsinoe batatas TaxID=2601811 RepID=A0A8K0PEQ3_9PEZI|nr:hypothetical protein KVT40_005946 [Elsinoe batatas]